MYAPPPRTVVPVVVPQRRGGFNGPLAALCCLGLILFLIASTIVLALIPIYIPRKDVTVNNNPTYYVVMTPNDTRIGDDGKLDADAQSAVLRSMEQALGLSSNSLGFNSDGATVSTTSGKRRRRGFDLTRNERQSLQQLIYAVLIFLVQFLLLCARTTNSIMKQICRKEDNITFGIVATFLFGGSVKHLFLRVVLYLERVVAPATMGSSTASTASTSRITTSAATSSSTSSTTTSTGVMNG